MGGEPCDPRMDADYFLPLRLEDTENLDGEWALIKRKELRLDIGKRSAHFVVSPGNFPGNSTETPGFRPRFPVKRTRGGVGE